MKNKKSLLATLEQKRTQIEKNSAKGRGKAISLHRSAAPEMRIFIRDNNRGMVGATFSAAPIRNGYHASRKRYYYQRGEVILSAMEVSNKAYAAKYNYAKFTKALRERLGRELAPSEVQEIIANASKGHATEAMAFAKCKVPNGVKVYAK